MWFPDKCFLCFTIIPPFFSPSEIVSVISLMHTSVVRLPQVNQQVGKLLQLHLLEPVQPLIAVSSTPVL